MILVKTEFILFLDQLGFVFFKKFTKIYLFSFPGVKALIQRLYGKGIASHESRGTEKKKHLLN